MPYLSRSLCVCLGLGLGDGPLMVSESVYHRTSLEVTVEGMMALCVVIMPW